MGCRLLADGVVKAGRLNRCAVVRKGLAPAAPVVFHSVAPGLSLEMSPRLSP